VFEPQDAILKALMDYFALALERAGSELADVLGIPVETRVGPGGPIRAEEAGQGGPPALIVAGAFSGAVEGPVAFVVPADAVARLAGRVRHLSEEEIVRNVGRPPSEEDAAAVVFALARLGAAASAVAGEKLGTELRWPAETTALTPTLASGGTGPGEALAVLGLGADPFAVQVHLAEPVNVSFRVVIPAAVAEGVGKLAGGETPHPAGAAGRNPRCGQMELARLRPVRLPVRVVVARRTMTVRELINLVPGRVVDLEKRCDEPLEFFTGPKLIGRGEAVVVDDHFGFRLSQLAESDPGEEHPSRVIQSQGQRAES